MSLQSALLQPNVIAILLGFVRISMFLAFLPLFGGRPLPKTVKIGLAVSLAGLFVTNLTSRSVSLGLAGDAWGLLAWLGVREATLGAGMGWLLGMLFVPGRIASAFIAQEMGLTIASLTSATDDGSSNVIAEVIDALVVLAFLSLHGHHLFFTVLRRSWDWFPIGTSSRTESPLPPSDWFCAKIIDTQALGISLAGPAIMVLLLTTVGILFVMRQAPQFNLFAFGMPVRLLVGLGLLVLLGPDVIDNSISLMQIWLGMKTG